MARNIDVIQTFINGGQKVKTKNLKIDGDKLLNYQTIIAKRDFKNGDYIFTINSTKYSRSTSTIQNQLVRLIPKSKIRNEFDNIPMGTKDF